VSLRIREEIRTRVSEEDLSRTLTNINFSNYKKHHIYNHNQFELFMCGIGAIYGKKITDKKGSISKSLSQIEHRGYSNYEIEVLKNCVLGCNRLQIVDKEKGKQPKANEDNTIFLVLNGEIFNFLELKKELLEKGHKFKSESDTEVLVHLWEEYKENMVKKIDSEMFAFFLYDEKEDTFFAARDPYGVKPLPLASFAT